MISISHWGMFPRLPDDKEAKAVAGANGGGFWNIWDFYKSLGRVDN